MTLVQYVLKCTTVSTTLINELLSCPIYIFHPWILILHTGKPTGELPECTQDLMVDATKGFYQHFLPVQEVK